MYGKGLTLSRAHVCADLRPYICTMETCDFKDLTFRSRRDFTLHERMHHDGGVKMRRRCIHCDTILEDAAQGVDHYSQCTSDQISPFFIGSGFTCQICGDWVHSQLPGYGPHVGQHMEEIAFSVVTKPYEDWTFYSASGSSQGSADSVEVVKRNAQVGPYRCERINHSTCEPCNSFFSRPADLKRHEDAVHNNHKMKVRCHLCTEEKTFSRNEALTLHMRVVHPHVELTGKPKKHSNRS